MNTASRSSHGGRSREKSRRSIARRSARVRMALGRSLGPWRASSAMGLDDTGRRAGALGAAVAARQRRRYPEGCRPGCDALTDARAARLISSTWRPMTLESHEHVRTEPPAEHLTAHEARDPRFTRR